AAFEHAEDVLVLRVAADGNLRVAREDDEHLRARLELGHESRARAVRTLLRACGDLFERRLVDVAQELDVAQDTDELAHVRTRFAKRRTSEPQNARKYTSCKSTTNAIAAEIRLKL